MSALTVYYNPTAGAGRAQRWWLRVQAWLNARQMAYQLWDDAALPEPDSDILILGGDGTFNHLLNRLKHPEDYRYLLLSAGTSNSLYSQISPKTSIADKLMRYSNCPAFRSIDLGQVTVDSKKTYRFVNEASVGFAAAIAHRMDTTNTKRHFNQLHLNELGYIATAFGCWRSEVPYMLSLCNNRRISGNLFPCPKADLSDGLIDVYELRCPRWLLPYELTRLVGARTERVSKYVHYLHTADETWTFDQALPVEIDGNPLPATRSLRLSVYPQQIRVM